MHKSNFMSQEILIVDDSPVVAQWLKACLSGSFNIKVIVADSLAETEALLQSHKHILLAVLDVHLPDAPEGEVIDVVLSNDIPVVVLTGTLNQDLQDTIKSKKIVDYVFKEGGWSLDCIKSIVKRIMKNPDIKVLVVDDSKSMRHFIKSLLEVHRFQVVEAINGEEGIKMMEANPDTMLVITDYAMPKMDGLEFISRLRKRYKAEQLGIIGLSAENKHDISARFLKMGANDFLHKPFTPEEFYARVNQNIATIELLRELNLAATTDFLTHLYNRRHFLSLAEAAFKEAQKKQIKMALAMLDIDNFKKINDTYGHDCGDKALQHFADLLKQHLDDDLIAGRFGGEEFCVIATGEQGDIVKFCENFRKHIETSPFQYGKHTIFFTVSIGLVFNDNAEKLEELFKKADTLLYQAKEAGKNRVII